MSKGSYLIAAAIAVAGIAIGAGLYLDDRDTATPSQPGAAGEEGAGGELVLKGAVVMDGTTNGCGGENILVEVREGAGNVVSESIPSDFVGLDCAFPFELEVPELDCYQVVISETVVGEYPRSALESGSESGVLDIGYIDSASVFGAPESFEPEAGSDWPYGCGGTG